MFSHGGVSQPNFIRIDAATPEAMSVFECCGVADKHGI